MFSQISPPKGRCTEYYVQSFPMPMPPSFSLPSPLPYMVPQNLALQWCKIFVINTRKTIIIHLHADIWHTFELCLLCYVMLCYAIRSNPIRFDFVLSSVLPFLWGLQEFDKNKKEKIGEQNFEELYRVL